MLFGGTTVTYGRGRGVVTDTGMQSQFGRIAVEVAAVEVAETPLEKRTSEIDKWLAVIALSVCTLVFEGCFQTPSILISSSG
jgi:Ca2+-transporting ATPase